MIIRFSDSEYRAVVAALARARRERAAPELDSALRKFDAWAAASGAGFTVATGEDALRARSQAPAGPRARRPARPAAPRKRRPQLPHTGEAVRAIHDRHGPGSLTLTVRSSHYVTGTFAGDNGRIHDVACGPGSALRWIAAAAEEPAAARATTRARPR